MSINGMVREISRILADCGPTIYLYGSSALNDFRLGWSDVDILVLTEKQISESQANLLVNLRRTMLADEPDNLYYRSFEGAMLTRSAFLANADDRVIYWGTSGERITDRYLLDGFGKTELIESSILLYGKDIRKELRYPDLHELYADVNRHYKTIRKYAQSTGRNFILSVGCWIYLVAYTHFAQARLFLKQSGRGLLKTTSPGCARLTTALNVRKCPLKYRYDKDTFDYAETLGEVVQHFADALEKELKAIE